MMPDITMCQNNACPTKEQCYRFKAKANPRWQSYSMFEHNGDGSCDMFIELWGETMPVQPSNGTGQGEMLDK